MDAEVVLNGIKTYFGNNIKLIFVFEEYEHWNTYSGRYTESYRLLV